MVDAARIAKKEELTMPGLVFWVYGLNFVVIWMMNDMVYNDIGRRLADEFKPGEQFFYYDNPWLFWLLMDSAVSLLIWIWPMWRFLGQLKDTESRLLIDILKSVLMLVVFVFFDLFISI